MSMEELKYCPGTLTEGNDTYSQTALKRMFAGRKVSHILPYAAPNSADATELFDANRERLSISGVQEKYSVLLEKNQLRLVQEGERGQYILKPIPRAGKNPEQMPANEHLTMQIARQVFKIETAESAMIFFRDGSPAYITKRFDFREKDAKWAQEDFASLAELSPARHGENYKYQGNYFNLFELLRQYVPAYKVEAPKLFTFLLFNYLFSNGDAHFTNFSLIETAMGDFRLSPAYDLLNSRLHIKDKDFALEEGLLPTRLAKGKVKDQFLKLGELAEIPERQVNKILNEITNGSDEVQRLIRQSYLSDRFQRNYKQAYLTRLKKLGRA